MPTLDRPNAPKRLPTGVIDSGLVRKRHGDGANPPSASLFTWTSPLESPVSPLTVVAQRKPLKSSHRKFQSEGSPRSFFEHGISISTALESIAPGVPRRDSSVAARSNSQDSTTSEPSSARSSISAKAKKLLNIPRLRIAGSATKDGAPPRAAKKGSHWHCEISGHWLEIRVGKTPSLESQSDKPSRNVSQLLNPPSSKPSFVIPVTSISNDIVVAIEAQPVPEPEPEPRSHGSEPSTPGPRQGLLDKTRRRLGIKRGVSETSTLPTTARTKTGETLERTSSKLRLIVTKQSQISSSPSGSSRHSSALSRTTSKWQRICGDRGKHDDSSSSSMRSVIQGKPPATTPDSLEMYNGADQNRYFRIEMTDADASNFLPSEARRVNTPPIRRNKARGFFFDYKPPTAETKPFKIQVGRRDTSGELEAELGGQPTRRVSATEWYNVQLEAIESEEAEKRAHFLSQLPEHLPNSPLCPRHPNCKSKVKGTCPMHGRKQTESSTEDTASARDGYRLQY